MSIFSRRKRTRHLASLAISAVATSLCSSQVALCLPFEVRVDRFFFDQNSMCFYILGCDENDFERKFETEMKVGKYKVYLTSENSKFEEKINGNTRYSGSFIRTIDFSDRSAESKLDILKQKLEKEQKITQEKKQKITQEEELKRKQEAELKRKQNKNNVNEIRNLIEEYERDSGYADEYSIEIDEYSIEINANGDSGLKENLRKIILCDPLIQHGLKYPNFYLTREMINKKLREITITREDDKYFIEVKLMK